ncbi:L-aspartate oxidase [Ruegeria pomeroyi]|nr:L-aspartate oxidase [Ruegeria pomeroyi]
MQDLRTDRVVIIGAGLAAIYAALKLAPHPVLMISPDPLGHGASSAWAQGGVAAAMDPADTPEAHACDTLRAGAGTVLQEVADYVTRAARDHILDLTDLGTTFDRTRDGGYVMSREAAHSAARVVRVKGDQAGAEIMRALIAALRQTRSVQVLEGVQVARLLVEAGRITGACLTSAAPEGSAPVTLRAPAVLLAAGGAAGLYALTTNPARIRGQALGMAARAGARIADAEFVQFHPTAIATGADPAPLATEALRGEGATLIDRHGQRFMSAVHPDGELAPRDVVARAVYLQTQAGNAPALDTRAAIGAHLPSLFPAVARACAEAGIDPLSTPIPVAAAAHYHMGGVAADLDGKSSLPGLWVCGEAASTGLHGANRLASNGLLEALVFARACARDIARQVRQTVAARVDIPFAPGGYAPDAQAVTELRRIMTDHVGVVRDGDGLRRALRAIAQIEATHPPCDAFANMTATATMIAAAALLRQESRGAHYRTDFPQAAPGPGQRSDLTLEQALALRNTL